MQSCRSRIGLAGIKIDLLEPDPTLSFGLFANGDKEGLEVLYMFVSTKVSLRIIIVLKNKNTICWQVFQVLASV